MVVAVPFLSRPVCLPVLARLWHPRQTGKLAHARVMVELVAARHPDRSIHAVGDAAYVGDHLRGLARQITWTSRLKVTSVLHHLAPPRTGRSGRPRTKGPRLGTPTDLAATACWRRTEVRRYGRVDLVWIAEIVCLWYGSFRGQTVRVVLVRDDKPRTRDRDERGYGLPLALAARAHPGYWNDPDMLQVGVYNTPEGWEGLTDVEATSHFSMWTLMAAPLIAGNDVRQISPPVSRILLNDEVIAVDQDPMGVQGRKMRDDGDTEVWAKPLANDRYAVILLNRGPRAMRITTTAAQVGAGIPGPYLLRDLWTHQTAPTTGRISALVPAHGVAMFSLRRA